MRPSLQSSPLLSKALKVVVGSLCVFGTALLAWLGTFYVGAGFFDFGNNVPAMLAIWFTLMLPIAILLVKVSWNYRAILAALLVTGAFVILPTPGCASENETSVDC